MSKPFMYWVRLALVATMCTLITFSPVSAGRWMDRLLHRDACNIPVDSCQTTGPAIWYAAPATSTTTCICVPEYVAPAVIDTGSSCCSTTQPDQVYPTQPTPAYVAPMEIAPPATREPISPAANQEVPAWTPPVVEHAPTLNAPAQSQPKVENPPATGTVKSPPVIQETAPSKVPSPSNVAEPSPFDAPVPPKSEPSPFDEPVTPKSEPSPFDEPVTPKSEPSPFDEPVTPKSEPSPFDEPAQATPEPAKADIDNLFDNPPERVATEGLETAPPMPEGPTPPTEPSIDNIFGTEEPQNASPKVEQSLDDILGRPINTSTQDADPSISAAPVDDATFFENLFSQPKTDHETSSTSDAAINPTFDISTTLEKSAPAAEPTPSDIAPETKSESPINSDLEIDKLFGENSYTPPKKFEGAEFRQWSDNTGAYQVNGRLAMIYSDKIRLLKENGKTTTVSLSRLSDSDFMYVQWVASNLTGGQGAMLVKTDGTVGNDGLR